MSEEQEQPQPEEQPAAEEAAPAPEEQPAEEPAAEAPPAEDTPAEAAPAQEQPAAPEQANQQAEDEGVPPQKEVQGSTAGVIVENPESRGKVYDSILHAIGNTPLVRLPRLTEKYHIESEILAKLEFCNPVASAKDRVAFAMIEDAEKAGKIQPSKTILIEPTSGNTGFSLAVVAAAKGYRLILTMPESVSIERRKILRYYGAELELTAAELGMKGAIEKSEQLLKFHNESYSPAQFENPANVQIHAETTAEEIWKDTEGQVDILVCGVGSGGTITGVSQALKKHKAEIQTYAVEPADSAILSGKDPGAHKIQGIGPGFVPAILDATVIDQVVQISNDQAFEMARDVAKTEGLPAGISSGAVMAAAVEVAKLPDNKGKKIVAILPSFAERYTDSDLFE